MTSLEIIVGVKGGALPFFYLFGLFSVFSILYHKQAGSATVLK